MITNMTVPKARTAYTSSIIKSLAQKEQIHRGDLRKKVLLKTTRRRYKQPLQRTRLFEEGNSTDSKNISNKMTVDGDEVKDYGCNSAQVSLPILVCCIVAAIGSFLVVMT
ncbi:hypothetical protein JTE90_002372 [Oedothorax gibbosus]|uniref:Uncharacterized protein n=1 Tax=Oedothorax gibbosus TaxID=931172 RepID=A0AAV6VCD0_9ARAC|nr:hypothetical protein JTE90_002372 [Oedothorax gibbosus]